MGNAEAPRPDLRAAAYFSAAQSVCPECRGLIQGKILFRDGKVILSKRCLRHGSFEALLSSDIDYWVKSLTYTKPGAVPAGFSTAVGQGCPQDCGLCPDHEQHTCTPIIEINNRCDLHCPVCIVWNQDSYEMGFAEFKGAVDGLLRKEGQLQVCLLSGGEPTLHPDFFRLAGYAATHPDIHRVLVSSHGLRLAQDDDFARRFADLGLYLSLQFDSTRPEHYRTLRGADLHALKMRCLERCAKYRIPTVFVMTVARGCNEGEIGRVVDFALSQEFATSVTVQPMAYTGSGGTSFPQDPLERLTQVDVHRLLAEQTNWIRREDFLPIPCSHPSCYSTCYALRLKDGSFTPLTRFLDVSACLDMLVNRGLLEAAAMDQRAIQSAVYALWSAQMVTLDTENVLGALKALMKEYEKAGDEAAFRALSESRVKAVYVHTFMDEYDFELSRVRKCCTHYVLPDGRLMPGCAYNAIHRFHDPRLSLGQLQVPARGSRR